MVEDQSSMVSRQCGRNHDPDNWQQKDNLEMDEIRMGKRPMESYEEEEDGAKKLVKQSSGEIDTTLTLGGIWMWKAVQTEQSEDPQEAGDNYDLSSLIPAIGRDNSISCLIRCSKADYGSIACLNRSFNWLIKSGEIYKLRRQNGVAEHWIYFSCHLLVWEAFDPIRRRWMSLPEINTNNCFIFADKESLAIGTELLVFGRAFKSLVSYRYSLLTNAWTSSITMNQPRCLFGSASLGEIAIVAGGCDMHGNIIGSAEMYNSETGTWMLLSGLNKPRKMCSAIFMDGKFYVIGGVGGDNSTELLTCGEEYDLTTNTWTVIPNMSPVHIREARNELPSMSEAPPLVAVVNNELYAADYVDMVVRKYVKETVDWITIGGLPDQANSMQGWGLAFRGCGDRLVIVGGARNAGMGFIEVNGWVPNDDGPPQWEVLGSKFSGSFIYNCAVMEC